MSANSGSAADSDFTSCYRPAAYALDWAEAAERAHAPQHSTRIGGASGPGA